MKDRPSIRNASATSLVFVASVTAAFAAVTTLAIGVPIDDAVISSEVLAATVVPPSVSLIGSAHAMPRQPVPSLTRPASKEAPANEPWNADESAQGNRSDATH